MVSVAGIQSHWMIQGNVKMESRIKIFRREKCMKRPIEVIEHHECEVLEKYNASLKKQGIAIQRFSDLRWYWVRWSEKHGNTADGIAYCPYCGKKL